MKIQLSVMKIREVSQEGDEDSPERELKEAVKIRPEFDTGVR